MALSATFKADFSSFYDAVEKANVVLADFGGGAAKAGDKLNKMAQQFSGQKIVQEATLMVKAIGGIEGIAKLTDKEIEKLGNTTNEAVEKLKRLGKDVPKSLQDVANATKQADKASIDWMGTLTSVAGAVGIAFSVDAIVGFIGKVFSAAAEIKNLSDQWGISTQAVQKWTGAAKAAGIESTTVGKSFQFMNEKLTESSKEYDALLKNIGLSGDALRKMKFEDAAQEILTTLGHIEDDATRADVALGLLGPSAKQMAGALGEGLVEAAAKQKAWSDETMRQLTEAEAQWGRFFDSLVLHSGNALAAVSLSFRGMTQSWQGFLKTLQIAMTQGPAAAAAFAASLEVWEQGAEASRAFAAALVPVASHGNAANVVIKTTAQVLEDERKKTEAAKKALDARTKAIEDAKRAEEAYTRELKKHDDALDALVNSFGGASGQGAIGKANDYIRALHNAIPIEQMSAKAKLDIHKAMDEAIVSYQAAGQMAPKVMYDIWLATRNATEGVIEFSSKWKNFADLVNTQPIDLGAGVTMSLPPALTALERFGTSVSRISIAISDIGRMGSGTFSEIAGAIGGVAGGLSAGALAAEDFDKALSNFKGKDKDIAKGMADTAAAAVVAASAFLEMTKGATVLQSTLTGAAMGASLAPGPYMAYGAAIGAVVGYIRGLHTANEDTISNLNKMKFHIAEAAGGWDKLAAAAKNAGAMQEYYALHNAESSQEIQWAAEALGKQLEFQATALEKVNEVAERYGITLEELGPAMQRSELDKKAQQLYHDWEVLNGAGLDTVVITEKMGAEMSAYINQAEKMGTDVPIAMKPMIEAMIKAGTLTDENGVAFADLEASGISFAMTMSDGFKAMIEEVKKLTDAIARGLGLAIENIPQPVIRGRVEWEGGRATPENIPRPEGGRPGGGLAPEYARGTDGFVNFGKGTPVILHGWEAVVPRGDAASMATVAQSSGGGGVAPTSVVINAQGAFFQTPADLQRLADKVGAALTAKYSVMGKLRAAV